MAEEQRKKTKQINFRLPPERGERFDAYCTDRQITMTQFLENAVRQALGEPLTIPSEVLGVASHRVATGESREWEEKLRDIESRLARLEYSPANMLASEETQSASLPPGIASIPIEELQLSHRAYNVLKRAQINTMADLLQYTEEDVLEIKNLGTKSLEEVADAVKRRTGLEFPKTRQTRPSFSELSPEEQRRQIREEREGKSQEAA